MDGTADLTQAIVNLTFSPAVPWWLLAVLATVGLVIGTYTIIRGARGGLLRMAALAVLLLTLANPTLIEEQRRPLSDIGVVVVDESASQDVGERRAQTEAALARIRQRTADWDDFELRELRVTDTVGDSAGAEDGTLLFEELRRTLAELPRARVAGVAVISDGQVHDAPVDPDALGLSSPLNVLLTGAENEADRRLEVVKVPRYGLVGKTQSLTLRIDDLGMENDGSPALVSIRQDGGEAETAFIPVGRERPVEFTLTHGGPTILEIEVEPADEELSLINNRVVVAVNGVRDRLRVLLVSGEPHTGERSWRNLLKADPSVDLVHFTILRPPEKNDGTPIRELSLIAFPIRELFEVKLAEFDLIIFDRYRRRNVLPRLYLHNIAEYVRNGGALLDAVGPTYASPLTLARTPLGEVLPGDPTGRILETGFKPTVVGVGHRHPVTARLPGANAPQESETSSPATPRWGRWFRQIEVAPKRGTVLMNGAQDRPLLILDRVGDGRVAQMLSDHMWLWAKGLEGGGPQAEFMRRVAHWLMKEPDLEENDLRATVDGDRITIERRSLEPTDAPVIVTGPDGASREVVLQDHSDGRATATIAAADVGLYRVEDTSQGPSGSAANMVTLTAVGPLNPREFADMRASTEKLEPIVSATEGGFVPLHASPRPDIRQVALDRDASGRDWIGFRRNQASVVVGVRETPMLPALLVLLLGMGALIWAWRREGA